MKRMYGKTISIILSISLLFALMPVTAFAGTGKKKYLFMGDSMSYNFVNDRHSYTTELSKDGHYPAQVAKKFGYNCINELGESPFTHGGIRATDIAAALSSKYQGDNYTRKFQSDVYNERTTSVEMLHSADVISIQLGHSSCARYALIELESLLGIGDGYGHDLSQIYTKDQICRIKPLAQRCIQNIALTNIQLRALEKCIDKNVAGKYRKSLVKIFGEKFVKTVEEIKPVANGLVDTILYALVSSTIDFDRMMKSVIKNKKCGADIYVIGLFNPAPDLKLQYTAGRETITISAKKLASVIFKTINKYLKCYSEYKWAYHYVNPPQGVETYYDMMANNSDENARNVTTELLTSYLSGGDLSNAVNTPGASSDALSMTPGAMKLAADNIINLNDIIQSVSNIDSLDDKIGNPEFLKNTLLLNESGNFTASSIDLLLARIELLTMLQGVAAHPTKSGHDVMAANLINAMK